MEVPQPDLQRSRRAIEEERKRKNRRNAVRRNRERASRMSFGYVAFLFVCVFVCGFAAAKLIQFQASTTKHLNEIAAAESRINDLRASNNETEKRLNTSVDLNEVKDTAINELGMTYASEDQIVYYQVNRSNHIDQYEDIPE